MSENNVKNIIQILIFYNQYLNINLIETFKMKQKANHKSEKTKNCVSFDNICREENPWVDMNFPVELSRPPEE